MIVPEAGTIEILSEPKQKKLIYTHLDTAETGPFQAEIRISATSRDSDLPPLRITVAGTVIPPYEFIPKQVAIAPQAVGTVATRTVKLSSIKQIPFRVQLPEEKSHGIAIDPLKSAEDDTWHEFEISVTVSEPGNVMYRPLLQVVPMSDVNRPAKLMLPIQAYGLDRNLAQRTPENSPQ